MVWSMFYFHPWGDDEQWKTRIFFKRVGKNRQLEDRLPGNFAIVTFLGWWFVTLLKVLGDLQIIGDSKVMSHKSPGVFMP